MDQLKIVLDVLKKHYFWFLSVLVIVMAMITWARATSVVADRYKSRSGALDAHFKSLQKITAQPGHPNQNLIEAIKGKTERLKQDVLEAWKILYKEQKDKNRLPDSLSPQFKTEFESLKAGANLSSTVLDVYQNFIQLHLPKLLEIGDILRPADQAGGPSPTSGAQGGVVPAPAVAPAPGKMPVPAVAAGKAVVGPGGGTKAPPVSVGGGAAIPPPSSVQEQTVGIVFWNEGDHRRLTERFRWEQRPTTDQVRLAQEDLWVCEALLRIIKNTNEGATSNYNAAVRQIESLKTGRDAIEAWEVVRETINMPGVTATAAPAASGDLQQRRYVDLNGRPVASDGPPPFAEFNMMPIHMKLVIDQRKLPKLLAECANSNMPVEVKLVRINPGRSQRIDLGATTTAATPAPSGAGKGKALVGSDNVGAGKPSGASDRSDADVTVELLGIIYIFNPPDEDKLGTGAAKQEPPPAAAPAAAPGAATPPAVVPAATTSAAHTTPSSAAPGPAAPAAAPAGAGAAEGTKP